MTDGVLPSADHPCTILESGRRTAASSRAHQLGCGPPRGQAFSLFSQANTSGSGAMQRREGEGDRREEGWETVKGEKEQRERLKGNCGDREIEVGLEEGGDERVMDFEFGGGLQ